MEVISMRLSQLLSLILAKTNLSVTVPQNSNCYIDNPQRLECNSLYDVIRDVVVRACIGAGLGKDGAEGFGSFIAEQVTGIPTQGCEQLYAAMLQGAYNSVVQDSPIAGKYFCLLSDWSEFNQHLSLIQDGIAEAFKIAKTL